MISLDLRPYCENCPNFEAAVEKIQLSNGEVLTTVRCENAVQCSNIYVHLEQKIKEKG